VNTRHVIEVVNQVKTCILFNFFLCVLIIISGCGYTTQAYFLPASIKTVYIETPRNKTDQPNLENELRTKLVSAFQNDGHLKIAANDSADAALKGEIISYTRQGLRYGNDESIREYRLTVTVNFQFIDTASGDVIVKADNFSGDTDFYLSGSSAKSESTARMEALDDLAHRMISRITTLW